MVAFDDAAKLVQRIRSQREASNGAQLPEEPTRDLLDSLALGPVIVRGHYEHDVKRFGEPYACGDIQAREQMKDVLINLQMSLIITLRTVFMDGLDLDFLALQTASDDCRVNAGVCLGQLSQRLSDAVRAQAFYPQPLSYYSGSGLMPHVSPSLGHSSSRSTHSSDAFLVSRTPDPMTEQFNNLNISPPIRSPYIDRMSTSSGGSAEQYIRPQPVVVSRATAEVHINAPPVGVHRVNESDAASMRRRSSQALAPDDNILLMFPRPGGQPILQAPPAIEQDADCESYVSSDKNSQIHSSPDISRASSGHQSQGSVGRFGPDDYGDQVGRSDARQYSHGTIYDMYQPGSPEPQASTSYSARAQASNHSTLDHVRYLQQNSRPPRPQPRSDSLNTAKTANQHREPLYPPPARSQTAGTLSPTEYQSRPPSLAPNPQVYQHQTQKSRPPTRPLSQPPQSQLEPRFFTGSKLLTPSTRAPSINTVVSSTPSTSIPLSTPSSGPVTLPTDKNLMGFCKGAFRLQAGLERKAFTVCNRPVGFASMTAYWRCEKCNFEGPVQNSVNMSEGSKKKAKPERVFDPRVRISEGGGVRYRWAFLARCHVALKGLVPFDTPLGREGAFGSFGCIFCCAESKSRGWTDASSSATMNASSNASIKPGHTANSAAKMSDSSIGQATPIFGNLSSFMQHLESVHRAQEGWPNAEMVGRMRVVIGRVAPLEEEGWEVNFVPL